MHGTDILQLGGFKPASMLEAFSFPACGCSLLANGHGAAQLSSRLLHDVVLQSPLLYGLFFFPDETLTRRSLSQRELFAGTVCAKNTRISCLLASQFHDFVFPLTAVLASDVFNRSTAPRRMIYLLNTHR
jgi:hypothetical protein